MKHIAISIFIFFTLSMLITDSFAFRCGTGLVSTGDSKKQVELTCGKPASKEKIGKERRSSAGRKKTVHSQNASGKVETWYYNCGDGDYIYALRFENGILEKESTEGKGRGKSECLGK